MPQLLLWFALAIGVTLFVVRLAAQWAMYWSARLIESRFQAAENIANEERVPPGWLRSFQRRRDRILRARGSEVQVQGAVERARRRCLRRLDGLIRFFEHSAFVDTPSTRHQLLRTLRAQRERWQGEEWPALLGLEQQGAGEDPDGREEG